MKASNPGERLINHYSADIARVDQQLPEITRLNDNLERSADVPEVFQSTIRKGIEDEQIDGMTELFAAASRIPYEEIGEEYLRRARALAEAEAMVTDEERRLAEGLELAKELTSKHHDQLDAIYGATAEEIRTRANHLDELRRQMEEIEELFDATSPAWPIPQGMSPEDITALYDMVNDSAKPTDEIVDILPVTPEDRAQTTSIAEKARRQVENGRLSDHVMFYLRARQGEIVTVEDIIRFCYEAGVDGDLDGDHRYRSRITTVLGPKSGGLKKQAELNADGLLLQYGWRYAREDTGDKWVTRRRTRIYRVVDTHQDTTEEDRGEVAEYHVTDRWRTTAGQVIANPVASPEATAETSDDVEQEQSAAWEETFIAGVDVAIDWAIEAQLFAWDLDEPRGSFIREMAGDDNIDTKEARATLVRAGYMTKGEAERDGMTRKQIIMSYLMNVVSELSGRDGRKRYGRASEIVDVMISQRLSELSDTTRSVG